MLYGRKFVWNVGNEGRNVYLQNPEDYMVLRQNEDCEALLSRLSDAGKGIDLVPSMYGRNGSKNITKLHFFPKEKDNRLT